VDKASIKSFVTCQKLARRGVSKIPPSQFRMIEEDVLKGLAPKESVYEKDDQEALKKAMDYKGQVQQDRKTNFTDKDGEESPNSQDQDALDDKPDSDEDIDDDDEGLSTTESRASTTRATMK